MSVPAVFRADAAALIPQPIVTEIFQGLEQQSLVMGSFQQIDVPVTQTRVPVLSGLPA